MRIIVLFSSVFFFALAVHTQAQSQGNAKTILDAMYQKYEASKSIEADFDLVIRLSEDEEEIQQGSMVQQADRFVIALQDYKVYNDGDDQWIHIFDSEEVQWTSADEAEEDALPNLKDIIGMYRSGAFDYVNVPSPALARSHAQIDFTPKDKDVDYYKIRLIVDVKEKEPVSMKFFYKDGSRYVLKINSLSYNKDFPISFFRFDADAHPGVHIEDLRID